MLRLICGALSTGGSSGQSCFDLTHIKLRSLSDSQPLVILNFNATGLKLNGFTLVRDKRQHGTTYIYIAIRRGPMRAPTDGTEVFETAFYGTAADSKAPGFRAPFPIDAAIQFYRTWCFRKYPVAFDRMRGALSILATSAANSRKRIQAAINLTTITLIHIPPHLLQSYTTLGSWMFRRAPGFFDVVATRAEQA
jgi:hypothetical protein